MCTFTSDSMEEKKPKYFIKNRIWIYTDEGAFLGEGRIALLKKIEEFGSISKAAEAMKMSYKKAWELVNSMNSQCVEPLVKRTVGGKGGGGTILTESGKNAIAVFQSVKEKSKISLRKEEDFINSEITKN